MRKAVGIDASPRALALAEAERVRRGIENVRFVQGDVASLEPIPDSSIDVAGAFDLLEHVDDATVRAMLRSLRRVLKPGGFLAAYTPNREHYVERMKAHGFVLKQFPEHIAVRRPREMRRLLEEEGWRVLETGVLDGAVSGGQMDREAARAGPGDRAAIPVPDPAEGGARLRSAGFVSVSLFARLGAGPSNR